MGKELAYIVSISEEHITTLIYQNDQEKRTLIAYKISSTDEENAVNIMSDLHALISHSELTLVSRMEHTGYLDTSYGCVKQRKILYCSVFYY